MVNGMVGTYEELTAGKVSTVENLVKGLFSYWESTECKIKQYTDIDEAIKRLDLTGIENEEKIRQAIKFNRKQISNSIRILFELGMSIDDMKTELMSPKQNCLVNLYKIILESELYENFRLKESFSEMEVNEAIQKGMTLERDSVDFHGIDIDTVVIHGIHQFTPIILRTIEHVAKYKRVVLLFNYQKQYKNVYQTWVDVYSSFDIPIKSQFSNEYKPNPLLPNSYKGNLLADKMANLIEGKNEGLDSQLDFEILEFDNNTEFASYVANVFEKASKEQDQHENPKSSTLYYMKEQFYSANNSVNNILKVYFPEQFGERHFLTYPIGHFFLSITNMWNPDEGGIKIENMNDVLECLCAGIIKEDVHGILSSIFNKTKEFFSRAESLEEIAELLVKLKKRIKKSVLSESENRIAGRLIYFDTSIEEVDLLIDALNQLNQITEVFYADFEDTKNNFREFYKRIKEFLETRVLEASDLDDEFRDIISRVLIRLEEVENIEANGSFDVLKETMSYYLKQENKKGKSANWIVRDFEQIDGDILKSRWQNKDTTYHFACLSDNDMNVTRSDRFPWPLDVDFFEVAQDPVDWKYQVYVKSRREYENFKRYALIYGLQFNRVKFKMSYVKNVDEKENEVFYLLRILGVKKKYPVLTTDEDNLQEIKNICLDDLEKVNDYSQFDIYRYRICKYRFLLESTLGKGTIYRDRFLLLKYMEILLENASRVALQGQIATEDLILKTLRDEYEKLKRKFEFAIDLDKLDIITNAKNYLYNSVLKKDTVFSNITNNDEVYMRKREEFIYLKLGKCDNDFSVKFKDASNAEIERLLNLERLDSLPYTKNCDKWCQYCAVREVCLEPYRYINN